MRAFAWFAALGLAGGLPGSDAWSAATSDFTTVVVTTNGLGSVTPDYNGRPLKIGSWLFPKTQPGPGQIFAGWTSNTGDCVQCNAFDVSPGLELCANFLPNPFLGLQGDYTGFFVETNGLAGPVAGTCSLHLKSQGEMSVIARLSGQSYSFYAEPFDLLKNAGTILGWRYDLICLTGDLYGGSLRQVLHASMPVLFAANPGAPIGGALDNGRDDYHGVKTPPTWTAQMLAYPLAYDAREHPAPQAGTYTLLLPPSGETNSPSGCGVAAVTVQPGGQVSARGFLADGTAFTHSATLASNGPWPLLAVLYGGHGYLAGWVEVTNSAGAAGQGALAWTRRALVSRTPFAAGFTNVTGASLHRFAKPNRPNQILGFTNGVVVMEGAAPGIAFTNTFTIGANGTVRNTGAYRFSLGFYRDTGLFSGTFEDPITRRMVVFRGAVVQEAACGYGYFLDAANRSRLVWLGP